MLRAAASLLVTFCSGMLLVVPTANGAQRLEQQLHRPYATHGGVSLHYDVIRPRDARRGVRRPVVVLLHGGGWWSGSKLALREQRPWLAQRLARNGFVVIAPEYRLACGTAEAPRQMLGSNFTKHPRALCGRGQHTLQDAVVDVQALLTHVHREAGALGVDRGRIAVVGLSAGGHLGLVAAATYAGPARVRAVSNWGGPVDTGELAVADADAERVAARRAGLWTIVPSFANAVGCWHAACPEAWARANPRVVLGARARGRGQFAVQLVRGRHERQVSGASYRAVHEELRGAGWQSEYVFARGACHGAGCANVRVAAGHRVGGTVYAGMRAFLRRELVLPIEAPPVG